MTKDKRMRRTAYKGSRAFFAIMQSGWILGGQSETTNAVLRCNVLDRLWKFPREGGAPQRLRELARSRTPDSVDFELELSDWWMSSQSTPPRPPHLRPVCRFVSHKLTGFQCNVRTCILRNSSAVRGTPLQTVPRFVNTRNRGNGALRRRSVVP